MKEWHETELEKELLTIDERNLLRKLRKNQ